MKIPPNVRWPWPRHRHPRMRLVSGIIVNFTTGTIHMSDSTKIVLTNAADPTKATRYLGAIDITNGTAAPSFTSSDPTKLVVVVDPAGVVNGKIAFGAYPLDADAETDDQVTVTVSLSGAPDIVLPFDISGTPVPPPAETDALDASGAVAAWAGAPAVPTSPV